MATSEGGNIEAQEYPVPKVPRTAEEASRLGSRLVAEAVNKQRPAGEVAKIIKNVQRVRRFLKEQQ